MTPALREIEEVEPALMSELISLFLNDSAPRFEALSQACAARNFRAMRGQAHSLKGSALQMGATGIASLCAVFEMAYEPEPDQCGAMAEALNREFALVRRAMEEYLANGSPTGARNTSK